MERKLRIAQIGVGHNHAREKMLTAKGLPDFEVVAVCEPDEGWRQKRGICECYRDVPFLSVEEVLALPDLDGVLIETDVPDLLPTAQLCVARGLNVHIDKPVGTDIDAFRALLATAKQKGLIFQVGYMYRGNQAVTDAIAKARSGELGEIYHIDAQLSHERSDDYRNYMKDFPCGNLYVFAVHLIDMTVAVMGAPRRVVPFTHKTMKNGIDVTDNCTLVLDYEKGSAVLRNSSVEVNGFARRQLVICGEKKTIEIKPLETPCLFGEASSHVDFCGDGKTVTQYPKQRRYEGHLRDFARLLRGEAEPLYSYEHEYLVHAIALAACGLTEYVCPPEDFRL